MKLNWLSLKKCLIFDKICYKKAIGKKHALVLPRQNVTLGKMLLGKLELGKMLSKQKWTRQVVTRQNVTRQVVTRQIVTRQNVADPVRARNLKEHHRTKLQSFLFGVLSFVDFDQRDSKKWEYEVTK